MKVRLSIILLLCFAFYSCTKDNNPLVTTTISGNFYDTGNGEPGHFSVIIGKTESKSGTGLFSGDHSSYIVVLDSTTTDANGNYKLSFKSHTIESTETYKLYCYAGPHKINVRDKQNNLYYLSDNSKSITSFGSTLVWDFEIEKLYVMKTRVIFKNNPYPPLYNFLASPDLITYPGNTIIHGSSNDTVVYFPIRKNTGGFYLQFNFRDQLNSTNYYSPKYPLNPLIDRDTINGGQYVLTPSTFTKTP